MALVWKRALDLAVTLLFAPVWVPVMLLGMGFVALVSPGASPIYVSRRVGQFGRDILIPKIRTMVPDADKIGPGATARNDPRFIPGAGFLRATKIDEMPQFLSVLKGELSLVGPRPELRQYVDLYSPEDREIILSVRPGIFDLGTLAFTDLQAHLGEGDAEAVFLEKFAAKKIELRREYVTQRSFWGDVVILVKTPVHIFASLLARRKA